MNKAIVGLISLVLVISLIGGCNEAEPREKYICPDGSIVYQPDGCPNTEISKQEAENIVQNFLINDGKVSPNDFKFPNTYKKGEYWKVTVTTAGGDGFIMEVNSISSGIEYAVIQGQRVTIDELFGSS